MSHLEPPDMKGDWNRRARENAEHYIATHDDPSDATFRASGLRDVAAFFDGLDDLLTARSRVLDVGSGIGRMDEFVAPRVMKLVGIDVSGEMVQKARARLAHLPNVEYVEGDGISLRPLSDQSFDLVWSHIVFQHVPRSVFLAYLPEVYRVLSRGGSFVFQMPEAVPGAPIDPPHDDTFSMRFWREEELRSALESVGFRWISCRRYPVETPVLNFNQLRLHAKRPA